MFQHGTDNLGSAGCRLVLGAGIWIGRSLKPTAVSFFFFFSFMSQQGINDLH